MTSDLMYRGAPPPPRPAANDLWQHSLYWLEESINVSLPHELDVRRMTNVLKGLWLVGERPTYDELKRYLHRLWPAFPSTQRRVRELWRTVERNPHHRFRRVTRHDMPLYIIDLICEHLRTRLAPSGCGARGASTRIGGTVSSRPQRFSALAYTTADIRPDGLAPR